MADLEKEAATQNIQLEEVVRFTTFEPRHSRVSLVRVQGAVISTFQRSLDGSSAA
jgi:hypothetical protein